MKFLMKIVVVLGCIVMLGSVYSFFFGSETTREVTNPVLSVFASHKNIVRQAENVNSSPEEQQSPAQNLLPYPQTPSFFSDMDMQYAFLLIQQGLDRSYLKDNSQLMLTNGNEFVINCWSEGMGLDLTEALAENQTKLEAWQNAVDQLWNLDEILSRDIKETLGTDKSVTIQIVDDVHTKAVLLRIRDGKIEYDLFRDGTAPKYEVFGTD